MSLWRAFKALGLGIGIYIVVALMLYGAGKLEFSLPVPPAPPAGSNALEWGWYFLQLIAYPFHVLFTIIWYGFQIAALPGVPSPLNLVISAIIIMLILYGIVEILLAIMDSMPPLPLPIPA